MKNRFKVLIIAAILGSATIFWGFTDDYFFKINKSFEIFSAVFREISRNYVLEVDPETLVRSGIDGMLETLDPYTVYYSDTDSDDIDMLTDGRYTGFGISVSTIDSFLTITAIREGYSAHKEGLRVGDKLMYIDTNFVLFTPNDKLRPFTSGEPGTKSNVKILRNGTSDTLGFVLERMEIKLKNVTYSGMLDSGIAYIKLERFSRNSPMEVRRALYRLKHEHELKGLVLDLRDNPGGLLDAAVSICEIFLPKGSLIVTTKGKDPDKSFRYTSDSNPIEPDLPLAVLINESSASASEVVAGAIQDHDRGVIIGKRSFGKGLVQSVFNLPFENNVKITTSKYYTPSGRCIQRIEFAELYTDQAVKPVQDTNYFYTNNGRKVMELTGIMPDSVVDKRQLGNFPSELISGNYIFNFANKWSAERESLPMGFEPDEALVNEFREFLKDEEFEYESPQVFIANRLIETLEDEEFDKGVVDEAEKLKERIAQMNVKLFDDNSVDIAELLKYEILMRFYTRDELEPVFLEKDNVAQSAVQILLDKKYSEMLAGEIDEKNSTDN